MQAGSPSKLISTSDFIPRSIQFADSPDTLKAALRAAKGDRALAFPHHIGYRQGARGINWDTFDRDLSPFVEMFSMHGCAETSENERSYLHSMGPVDGHSTMEWGLSLGHVFGVVGNTDHHSGFPGSWGHGRTGLYASGRDREAIWSALQARGTNALTGDSTHLLTAIGDTIQGGVIEPASSASLRIEAVAGGFIDTIDVVRNGRLFTRISPALMPAPIDAGNGGIETVLHVELGWGARGKSHDWTGAIHLENGEILAVEPRFRGAEIVSPLEGEDPGHAVPKLEFGDGRATFAVRAEANPNNVTPATQGLALRLRVHDGSIVHAELSGKQISIPVARLFEGAVSGNLGPIDTPAYRFHGLPLPHQWQWHGDVPLGAVADGENIRVRLRQANGQTAWTSPIFCRRNFGK